MESNKFYGLPWTSAAAATARHTERIDLRRLSSSMPLYIKRTGHAAAGGFPGDVDGIADLAKDANIRGTKGLCEMQIDLQSPIVIEQWM